MLEATLAFVIGACIGLSLFGVLFISMLYFFPVRQPIRVLSRKKHLKLIQGGRRK